MDKIVKCKVFSLHSLPDGILYSYLIEKTDDQYKVGYKMISFETGQVSSVTKSIYLLTKFGTDFESFVGRIKNYLTCFSVLLSDGHTFVLETDGSAYLFGNGGTVVWQGKMLYQDAAPGGLAAHDGSLWVSFPERSALIRYDLQNFREQLRIGGASSPLKGCRGLFPAGSKMFVCCSEGKAIWKLDTFTYQTELYYDFDEPVRDYKFINKHEIALTKSGIYLL